MTEESSIEDKIARLTEHFGKNIITPDVVEERLRLEQELTNPNVHVKEILSTEPSTFMKYGIYKKHDGGRDFYALPCTLDHDSFPDLETFNSTKDDLVSKKIEPHDLPMEYFFTGYLRKFSYADDDWVGAQKDHALISDQSFRFLTNAAFIEAFQEDYAAYKEQKQAAGQQDQNNLPEFPIS